VGYRVLPGRASHPQPDQVVFGSGTANEAELRAVNDLIEAGTLRPVIERTYAFEQTAEAPVRRDGAQAGPRRRPR
jgi:NADPH:quinone reductase-like Zn-dependent oxidoreductase